MSTDHAGAVRTVGWVYLTLACGVAALGGLLFGYDTAVISGAIGFLQEHFAMSAAMKGWAASSALAGCIIGVAAAGALSDYLGRKKVLVLAAVLFLVSAMGTALPRSLAEFVFFRVVGGVGVGAASMTSPMYIAEIAPAHIRGRMVSLNQFTIIFGMLVVYFVNYGIAAAGDEAWNAETGWRWMFGSEALPAALLLVLLFFVPETPRWLVKQGREAEAEALLARINGPARAAAELAEIREAAGRRAVSVSEVYTPRFLEVIFFGPFIASLFYLIYNLLREVFAPGLRVALVIGVVLAVLQQVTGINVILYYAPEIFKASGVETAAALWQTIIVGAVNLLFTIVAIWTVDKLGRKPLMIFGAAGMGVSLFALGMAFHLERTAGWMLVFVLGYIACFAVAVGPVTWVILSEIFPTRIRGRAMAIATVFLWAANFVVSQTFPMLDEHPWLVERFHHGFSFWIYAVMCAAQVVFVWRLVPETKNRSLEDIERFWETRPSPPV